MEVYHSFSEIGDSRPSAVALGFFDGLHLGHMALITRTIEYARSRGLSADVFTFREHPRNVMAGKLVVPRLLTEAGKLGKLEALGIDRIFDFDFADGFHTMPPKAFARTLLKESFAAEAVFCGFNFRFGAGAAGNTEALIGFGQSYGFETNVLDPVYAADKLVSSTEIRRLVNSGEVETAALLLGRDYGLNGIVEKGRRIGHALGFPTANIIPGSDMTLPAFGVYVTETEVDGELYPSVSNIGVAPTVSDSDLMRIEPHLLDTDITLYGKEITIFFKKMLREERRFENEEALKHQIAADAEAARNFF